MGARPSRDNGLARVWHVHSVGVVCVQGQRVIKAALRDSSARRPRCGAGDSISVHGCGPIGLKCTSRADFSRMNLRLAQGQVQSVWSAETGAQLRCFLEKLWPQVVL